MPLKLTLKNPSAPATAPSAASKTTPNKPEKKREPKKKQKVSSPDDAPLASKSKKRARNADDGSSPAAKRPAKGVSEGATRPKLSLKLSSKSIATTKNEVSTPKIKIKAQRTQNLKLKTSRVVPRPARPLGVGYDSEAEDIEDDPLVESQFILRMLPGEDCDYLANAIRERKIGASRSEGGADVTMKFHDNKARRVTVSIKGKHYAAMLVDLPNIIESHKSWDRRSHMKVADIAQMLLVLGQVKNDEEAKTYPRPSDVNENFQYAHGITPPMHNVRKRRFRKRVSHLTVEAVEEKVNRLIAADRAVVESGGTVESDILHPESFREEDEEEDAYGEEDDDGYFDDQVQQSIENVEGDADAMSDDDLENAMAAAFEETLVEATPNEPLTGTVTNAPMQGSPEAIQPNTTTPATPDAQAASADDEEDDSSDEDDDEELDEEQLAEQAKQQQLLEEIEELKENIREKDRRIPTLTNPIMRNKVKQNRDQLVKEVNLKLRAAGMEEYEPTA